MKKYTLHEVELFIRKLAPTSDLGQLQSSSEKEVEKPWETKLTEIVDRKSVV